MGVQKKMLAVGDRVTITYEDGLFHTRSLPRIVICTVTARKGYRYGAKHTLDNGSVIHQTADGVLASNVRLYSPEDDGRVAQVQAAKRVDEVLRVDCPRRLLALSTEELTAIADKLEAAASAAAKKENTPA